MISNMQHRPSRGKARLIWLIVVLAGLGGGAFYFHQHPDRVPEWAAKSAMGRELQSTTVYKWQDAAGNWHISDRKPPENVDHVQDRYTRDTNVLPLPPELQR